MSEAIRDKIFNLFNMIIPMVLMSNNLDMTKIYTISLPILLLIFTSVISNYYNKIYINIHNYLFGTNDNKVSIKVYNINEKGESSYSRRNRIFEMIEDYISTINNNNNLSCYRHKFISEKKLRVIFITQFMNQYIQYNVIILLNIDLMEMK